MSQSFFSAPQIDQTDNDKPAEFLISADDIFSSKIKGYEKFAAILHTSNAFSRSVMYNGNKITEATLNAEELKVEMLQGCHCAMLLGRLAKSVVISKITILSTQLIKGKRIELYKKEFSKCVLQTYSEQDDICSFSARFNALNVSYENLKPDGTKQGNAAAKIDLLKWKVDSK